MVTTVSTGFRGDRSGVHETEPTDFIETFASLKPRKVIYIFIYRKKKKEKVS
jgi:hypothetical protein